MSEIKFDLYEITGNDIVEMLHVTKSREVAWVLMSIFAGYTGPFTKNQKEQDKLFALFLNLQKSEVDLFHHLLEDMNIITKSSPNWQNLLQYIYERCTSREDSNISLDEIIFIFDGSIINQLYEEILHATWILFRSHCKERNKSIKAGGSK